MKTESCMGSQLIFFVSVGSNEAQSWHWQNQGITEEETPVITNNSHSEIDFIPGPSPPEWLSQDNEDILQSSDDSNWPELCKSSDNASISTLLTFLQCNYFLREMQPDLSIWDILHP
jgi:hypothetical protein